VLFEKVLAHDTVDDASQKACMSAEVGKAQLVVMSGR